MEKYLKIKFQQNLNRKINHKIKVLFIFILVSVIIYEKKSLSYLTKFNVNITFIKLFYNYCDKYISIDLQDTIYIIKVLIYTQEFMWIL